MVKKFKRFKKVRKVKDQAAEVISEKAAGLNPLGSGQADIPTLEDVPRITNETIAEHREEVLKGARKYIYPLQHSKRTIIFVTLTVIVAAVIGLFVYCSMALYKFYQSNTFLYRVTQVVPFPIAKAGGSYVNYENYLFELRHYVHYYENQQQNLFGGQDQIKTFRKQALNNVIADAYVKQLARSHKVSVSDKEVSARLNEVRAQNRLGGNDKVFADVLRSYWGWSINDFKRSLKTEILSEKVAAKLDAAAGQKAAAALAKARAPGADFAGLAKQLSEDKTSAPNGGDYGFAITKTNPNVPPEVVDALFKLKPGQVSDVILASPVLASQGPSLQIVKLTAVSGDSVTAQRIVFNLQDISTYVDQLKKQKPVRSYVHF